jgi:predicted RNA binding protein YcfA (HicA-like mRNA interferase family)
MSKLPIVSGKECIKALEKIGFVMFRQRGSHITMVRENPQCQITIPNHKTVAKGTLKELLDKQI